MNKQKRTEKKSPTRNWFRKRRRWHDPMLVFNMSVFNSGGNQGWILSRLSPRENVWC